jgi:REP element-mobilizing transposase RayT
MRRPRELRFDARYHVTTRANAKGIIRYTNAMKELFLSVVKRAKGTYDFRLENLCVMGNHFHFITKPVNGEYLSAMMRWIMSVFAMRYNRIKAASDHAWGCPFFSRIIRTFGPNMQGQFRLPEPLSKNAALIRRIPRYSVVFDHWIRTDQYPTLCTRDRSRIGDSLPCRS